MKTNKFLVGGIIGGIANFLMGWLVWGILLKSFMEEHTSVAGKAVMRPEADMNMLALALGNLILGFLMAYVLMKASAKTAMAGATIAGITGLLMSSAFNMFTYSMMYMSDKTAIMVDVAASTVVAAITGAIIGWFYGRRMKSAA